MTSMQVFTVVSLIAAAIKAGTPLLFASLGEILTEKSGSLNLGVEGIMYLGAVAGFACGYYTDSIALTLVATFLAGAAGSLIYAFLTATLKADQNVTGLTLTIFGTGVCNMVGALINNAAKAAGATAKLSARIMGAYASFDRGLPVPGTGSIPLNVYLDKLLNGINPFVIAAVGAAFIMAFVFNRTRVGLSLRAVGESPATADAMGINVTRYRYLAACIGGGLIGLGGLYVCMNVGGKWEFDLISGQGWLAVALVIFSTWNPKRAVWGSLFFGALLRLYLHYKLTFLPNAYEAFVVMLPYVVTVIVLVITSIRQSRDHSQPASCGTNYFREER